ncbi:hypothetical protein DMA11_04340 [Marinilabiliaceae bacterium JC017]|nr:hypothetical protein DMA11_04340 [Marinilabiliaceae bacterium JC017]
MNRMKYFRTLLVVSLGMLMLCAQPIHGQKEISRKEKRTITNYFNQMYKAKGPILKSASGATGTIPSLGDSYCSESSPEDLVPPSWDPAAKSIEWTITTFVGKAVEHPEWGEYVGTGQSTVFRFYPDKVDPAYYGVRIYFSYIQLNEIGLPVGSTNNDYTIVYQTPSVFDFGSDQGVCQGESATLTLAGSETGIEYFLLNSSGNPVGFPMNGSGGPIDFSVSAADTYTVEAKNSADNACVKAMNGSATVTVNPKPNPIASNGGPVCEGKNLQLTAAPDGLTTYAWSGPDGFSSNEQSPLISSITADKAGTYILTVTDGNSCQNTATTDVIVYENPTVTVSNSSPACVGSQVTITAVPAGGSGTGYTFSWKKDGVDLGIATAQITIGAAAVVDAGEYEVTVTDSHACSSVASAKTIVIVNENPQIDNLTYNDPVCVGSTLKLTAAPSGGSGTYVTYAWTKDGNPIIGETGSTLSIANAQLADAANYGVKVTDSNGCESTELVVNVVVNALPNPTASNSGPVCEGKNLELDGGPDGLTSYSWSGPDSFTSNEQKPLINNVTLVNAGTYTLTVTDGNTCENSITTDVIVYENPTVTVSNSGPVCVGSQVTITAVPAGGSGAGYSFSWKKGGVDLGITTAQITIGAAAINDAGEYEVTVTDSHGCASVASAKTILIVNENPQIDNLSYNDPVCDGSLLSITATASGGDGNYVYIWKKDGVVIPGETNAVLSIANAKPADSGNYEVIVKDLIGCESSASNINVTVHALPNPTATNDGPVCEGGDVELTGGPDGLTSYSWVGPESFTSNSQKPLISGVTLGKAGTYTLTVTDGNTCQNSVTTDVVVNANPTVTATNSGPVCEGKQITITATPAGGSGTGYTYSWKKDGADLGFTTEQITIGAAAIGDAGTYEVTVKDDNACSSIAAAATSVVVNENPTITDFSSNSPVCQNTQLTITATVAGGSGNYIYKWEKDGILLTGETSDVISISNAEISDAGSYKVTVHDDLGCGDVTQTTNVVVNAAPTVSAVNNGPVCIGKQAVITATPAGGSGAGYTFSWEKNGADLGISTGQITIGAAGVDDAGIYKVTVTDGLACQAISSATTELVVLDNPEITTLVYNDPVCLNSELSITATATGGSGNYVYEWKKAGVVIPGQTAAVLTITNAQISDSGNYEVKVSDDEGCGSATKSIDVTVHPLPTPTASNNGAKCEGSNLQLIGGPDGFAAYSWEGPDSYASNEQSPLITNISVGQAGAYKLTVTDANTCQNSVVTDVIVNPNPTVTVVNSSPVCEGNQVIITATPAGGSGTGYTFSWKKDGEDMGIATGTITIANATSDDAGIFEVTVTDDNACVSQVAAITEVKVNSSPVITGLTSNSPVCEGSSITIEATTAGGAGDYVYVWKKDGTVIAGESNSTLTVNKATPAEGGNYEVTVTDKIGCGSASSSVNVVVHAATIVVANNDGAVCEGADLQLNGGPDGMISYSWTGPDTYTSNIQSPVINGITLAKAGTYALTIVDGNNCSYSATTDVVVNENPTVNVVNSSPVCVGKQLVLTATPTGGSGTGYTYNWEKDGVDLGISTSDITIASAAIIDAGTYKVTVTDDNTCSSVDAATTDVVVNENPIIESLISNKPAVCEGNELVITATASGGAGNYVYIWKFNGVEIAGENNSVLTIDKAQPSDGGEYSVIVTDKNSCGSAEEKITVVVNAAPTVTIDNKTPVCVDQQIVLTANSTGGSGSGYTFSWKKDDVDLGITTAQITIANASIGDNGLYEVTVTDDNGCSVITSAKTNVIVNENPKVSVVNDGPVCEGSQLVLTATPTGGSGTGYKFEWKKDGLDLGFTTPEITIASASAVDAGLYEVKVSDDNTCSSDVDNTTVVVNELPIEYNLVTPNGNDEETGCNGGTGWVIGVDNSQTGVTYQLLLNGGVTETLPGNDGDALSFSAQLTIGVYTIYAVKDATGCSQLMTGTFTILGDGSDVAFDVSGVPADGRYCEGGDGVEIKLEGSLDDNTVDYILYRNGIDTGVKKPGNNGEISFGKFTEEGTYTVRVKSSSGCDFPMNGNVVVKKVATPKSYDLLIDKNGHYCDGGAGVNIEIAGQQKDYLYQLYKDGVSLGTAVPGSVDDDNEPLKFAGPFTEAGEYSVQVTIPGVGCQAMMNNNVTVVVDPLPTVYTVTTDGDYCEDKSTFIRLDGSEADVHYRWERNDGTVGTWTDGNGGVMAFEISDGGIYSVSAEKTDGITGCAIEMNGKVTILEKPLPDHKIVFELSHEGTGCGDGDVITVRNSEIGVIYELAKKSSGVLVPTGNQVTGTGGDIDFNSVVDKAARYYVLANLNGCEKQLDGFVDVDVPGAINKYNVTGSGDICNGDPGVVFGLDSSEDGVKYTLYLVDGAGAGVDKIINAQVGSGSTLTFDLANEEGTYYVLGNSGVCDVEMLNRVTLTVNSLPVAYQMTGSGFFCDPAEGAVIGIDGSEEKVEYTLQFNDGAGNRNWATAVGGASAEPIVFGKYTDLGDYTVIAKTEKGCTSSMNGTVKTQQVSAPTDFRVNSDKTEYCDDEAGADLVIEHSESDVVYQVLDASDVIVAEIPGDGSDNLKLGTFKDNTYKVVAAYGGDACPVNMNGGASISITEINRPKKYNLSVNNDNVCGTSGTVLTLDNSENGIMYQLLGDDVIVSGEEKLGDGSPVNWNVSESGSGTVIYEVNAVNAGACELSMGTVDVNYKAAPTEVNVIPVNPSYCQGSEGVKIGLETNEDGVGYELVNNVDETVDFIRGTGSATPSYFSIPHEAGTYTIKSTYLASGCEHTFITPIVINEQEGPAKLAVVTEGGRNLIGDEVIIENSVSGVTYQLYFNDTSVGDAIVSNGGRISFGVQNEAGNYTVQATNTNGCQNWMEQLVLSADLIPDSDISSPKADWCEDDEPVIQIDGTKTGIRYDVYNEAGQVVGQGNGNGGTILIKDKTPVDFDGASNRLLEYRISATDINSGQTKDLGSQEVTVWQEPTVFNATSYYGSSKSEDSKLYDDDEHLPVKSVEIAKCQLSENVIISLNNFEKDFVYRLYYDSSNANNFDEVPGSQKIGGSDNLDWTLSKFGYYKIGVDNKGCASVRFMRDNSHIKLRKYANPLAVKDTLRVESGYTVGDIDVSLNDNVDNGGLREKDGSISYKFEVIDPDKLPEKEQYQHIGTSTIIDSHMSYTKLPGFFGKDSLAYRIYLSDEINCRDISDTAKVLVIVGNKKLDGKSILVPNAFSPNSDGYNDLFVISGIDNMSSSSLEVYNRWGTIVYRSKGQKYANDWDGKANAGSMVSIGEDLPNGTYFYVFKVAVIKEVDNNKEEVEENYSGYIELRR